MLYKIRFTILTLLVYLIGYRPYTIYAKWKTFDNRIVPWDTILLKKGTDIHSGTAMAKALSQTGFFEIFKDCYIYDHLEPTTIFDYLEDKLIV